MINPQSSGRNRSGFTLIELIISSVLMTMILVSAYSCLNAAYSSQKLIEPRVEIIQNARVAMAILSADLRGACPLSTNYQFLGMHRMLGEMDADNLDFATQITPHVSRTKAISAKSVSTWTKIPCRAPAHSGAGAIRLSRRIRFPAAAGKKLPVACSDSGSNTTMGSTGTTPGETLKVRANNSLPPANIQTSSGCLMQCASLCCSTAARDRGHPHHRQRSLRWKPRRLLPHPTLRQKTPPNRLWYSRRSPG